MKYNLLEVTNKKLAKRFLDTPRVLYKNDKNYVCPLDSIIEGIFSPDRNEFFSHGAACRWILTDENDQLVGRIAAFVNRKKAYTFQQPTGGIGFFECINDQEAAFQLFDIARQWNQAQGMQAMDGPINFGENDNFWGLLVEGFMPQSFGMNYNPPYYKNLFENYGFQFYFEQISNHLDLTKPFPERFWKIADWVRRKEEYSCEHFDPNNEERYAKAFSEIYNDAWQFHENFVPMTFDAIKKALTSMKAFMIPEFIWFAFHQGEPIAFEIMIPDLNQKIRILNGKTDFWNKLQFLLAPRSEKKFTRSRIVIMGVKPKFQKSGIESALFWHMNEVMRRKPDYTEIELSWVGDFNPKMRQLHESVGATFAKRHITYRKLFDSSTEQRSSIIPVDTREKILEN